MLSTARFLFVRQSNVVHIGAANDRTEVNLQNINDLRLFFLNLYQELLSALLTFFNFNSTTMKYLEEDIISYWNQICRG